MDSVFGGKMGLMYNGKLYFLSRRNILFFRNLYLEIILCRDSSVNAVEFRERGSLYNAVCMGWV